MVSSIFAKATLVDFPEFTKPIQSSYIILTPHFLCILQPNSEDGKCVINVHVNKLYNTGSSSFDRDPGERSNVGLVQRRGGPSKCLSCSAVLVERYTEYLCGLS